MSKTLLDIRNDFPLLHRRINNHPLVYLDNAATTQKPQVVIDSLMEYYRGYNSNIHRGVHYLSQQATSAFEEARQSVQTFLHAAEAAEIIFTKGTTESINLVATSFGGAFLASGDQILVSQMEHHSNIVPWQIVAQQKGASVIPIPMNEAGVLDMHAFEQLLNPRVKMVAIAQVSNSLGTINPVKEIIEKAHAKHIPVLIDGAQAVPHLAVDVQALDADFYCFSAHKLYAPMGVGVLYGKREWLEKMPPYQGGGEMINEVSFAQTTYNEIPYKFEAGTPAVGEVIALKAAIDYLHSLTWQWITQHEQHLMQYGLEKLLEIPTLRLIGQSPQRSGVISFLVGNTHPFDIGTLLDQMGVAVRTGHHCAQPVMQCFQIPGTVRVSFAVYTSTEDIDQMILALKKAAHMLQ